MALKHVEFKKEDDEGQVVEWKTEVHKEGVHISARNLKYDSGFFLVLALKPRARDLLEVERFSWPAETMEALGLSRNDESHKIVVR